MDNIQYSLQFFKDAGYEPYHAKGIVANLLQESDLLPTALSKGGKYYGVAQWDKERRKELFNYANRNNMSPDKLDTQLQFIMHELLTTETQARDALLNSKNEHEATINFRKFYERPGAADASLRLKQLNKLSVYPEELSFIDKLYKTAIGTLSPSTAEAAVNPKDLIKTLPQPNPKATFLPEVTNSVDVAYKEAINTLKNPVDTPFADTISSIDNIYLNAINSLKSSTVQSSKNTIPLIPDIEIPTVDAAAPPIVAGTKSVMMPDKVYDEIAKTIPKPPPQISADYSIGLNIPEPEKELPLKYDIPLFLASDIAAGSVTAPGGPLAVAASPMLAGAIYQTAREAISALGGPTASRPLSTRGFQLPDLLGGGKVTGLEEKVPDELKPWVRTFGQSLEFPMWILGAKGALKAGGKTVKAIDAVVSEPLAKFSDKFWKPIADWTVNSVIIKPATDEKLYGMHLSPELVKLFQPATERLRKLPEQIGTVKTFEEGRAQRNIIRAFGTKVADTVNTFLPSERLEFMRALSEKEYSATTPKVKTLVKESTDFMSGNLTPQYTDAFNKEFNRLIFKPLKQARKDYPLDVADLALTQREALGSEEYATKAARVYNKYLDFMGKPEQQEWTPGAIRNLLEDVIYDPQLPVAFKQQAAVLYNLPHQLTVDIGRSSNIAMRDFIIQDLLKNPNAVSPIAGGDFVKSTWHKLKGLNIHKDIETELHSMDKLFKPAQGWYNEWFLPTWKTNKVILRPAAWGRNIISNFLLNDMGGLPWYRMDIYNQALKEMRINSSGYKEFAKMGRFADIFTSEDVGTLSRFARHDDNVFSSGLRLYNTIADPARSMYGAAEQWAKYSKYLHNLERGLPKEEAVKDAIKWTFNYGETSSFIQAVRQSRFGMPFVTWWSKAIPLGMETMVHHPLRLGKWFGLYKLWQAHALDQVGMSNDEWNTMQNQFTGYMKGGMYTLMPWRDEKGQLKLLNLTWMLPFIGDVSEILNRSQENIWTLAFQSPITSAIGTLTTKTLQGGAPLYYDWEKPESKAMKTFGFLWNLWVPSMVPGGIDYKKAMDTINQRPEALSSEECLAAQLGLPLKTVNPSSVKRKSIAMKQIHEAEVGMWLNTQLRKTNDPKEKQELLNEFRESVKRIWKKD